MPLSALMTFLFTNISPLTCLWSDMLCQHDGVVPNDFMTNFALMTNHTQKIVLLLNQAIPGESPNTILTNTFVAGNNGERTG